MITGRVGPDDSRVDKQGQECLYVGNGFSHCEVMKLREHARTIWFAAVLFLKTPVVYLSQSVRVCAAVRLAWWSESGQFMRMTAGAARNRTHERGENDGSFEKKHDEE